MTADEAKLEIVEVVGRANFSEPVPEWSEIVHVLKDIIPASNKDELQELVLTVEQLAVAKSVVIPKYEQGIIDLWRMSGRLSPQHEEKLAQLKERLLDGK